MSDSTPFDLLKDELSNDDVSKLIKTYYILITPYTHHTDSNKSKCNSQITNRNGIYDF